MTLPLLLLLACAGEDKPAPDDSAGLGVTGLDQLAALGARDLIVVHADTLRADALPMYGATRETTPSLSAAGTLTVRGWHAAAPWTMPSTLSALTGLSPERHGAVTMDGATGDSAALTLAERLQVSGYATFFATGNKLLAGDAFTERGFELGQDPTALESTADQHANNLWDALQPELDALDAEAPVFVWLQAMDTHTPYHPVEPFLGTWADYSQVPFDIEDGTFDQLDDFQTAYNAATTETERAAVVQATRDVYDELVLQHDATVGQILDWLASSGRAERALVVFTSDHGETIADDGLADIGHSSTIRPELVELPLVFAHPALDGGSVDCLASNEDLGPTLLGALGLEALPEVDGQDVVTSGCRARVFASLVNPNGDDHTLKQVTVLDERWRLDWLCLDGIAELYDLAADPRALSPVDLSTSEDWRPYWSELEAWLVSATAHEPDFACPVAVPDGP